MNELYTLECAPEEVTVIVDPARFDASVLVKGADAPFFLDGRIHSTEIKGITYSTAGLVSLRDFLSQIQFQEDEACSFLHGLFDTLAAGMKNQPVILESRAIFLSEKGDEIFLLRAPLEFSGWIRRDEEIRRLIQEILDEFPAGNLLVLGLLYRSLKEEPDLMQLQEELEIIWKTTRKGWKTLFRKQMPDYQSARPVYPLESGGLKRSPTESPPALYVEDSPGLCWNAEQPVPDRQKSLVEKPQFKKQEKQEELKTVLLSEWMAPASLEIEGIRHQLEGGELLIGRKTGSSIQLLDPSVSAQHARLTCTENRWYIQDLKSANGTWLNEKRVTRKMRLKEGMILRFGAKEAVFHEQPFQRS